MKLYSKQELARLWDVSVSQIEKLIREGKLTFVRVGKLVRFREEDLQAYLGKTLGTTLHYVPPNTGKQQNASTENNGTYGIVRGGK